MSEVDENGQAKPVPTNNPVGGSPIVQPQQPQNVASSNPVSAAPQFGNPFQPQPPASQPLVPQPPASQPLAPQLPGFQDPGQQLPGVVADSSSADPDQSPGSQPQSHKEGKGKLVLTTVLLAALVGGVAGYGGSVLGGMTQPESSVASGLETITINNPDNVSAVTAVAAKVLPSIVTISAVGSQNAGSGTGVIVSEDGYIITNNHVVTLGGASRNASIKIKTSDGRFFDATVVGTDPTYDLAVIQAVDASGLTPIEIADSSKLNVGDQTIALGAPLGLDNTVTTGIVSALNRSVQVRSSAVPENINSADSDPADQIPDSEEDENQERFELPGIAQGVQTGMITIAVVQTDAAINSGNSGGALVDNSGKLVGINVAIASTGSGGNIGVGFSIPSNIAKRIADEIIANGSATHGLLGVSVTDNAAIEDATFAGATVKEVTQGGAAEQAGIRQDDVIIGFAGIAIGSSADLTAQVRALAANSEADVTYVRDGKKATVSVTLGIM